MRIVLDTGVVLIGGSPKMENQLAQDQYDLKSITRLGSKRKATAQRDIFSFLIPTLPDNAKVLEVGTGRGEFAQECLLRKLTYVGVEPSSKLALELANLGISTINDIVPPIPARHEQFNLVHSYDFIEHLCSYVDVMEFFSESYRVLKPGGYISTIAPNYETLKHLFFQYEYQHSYIVTKDRVENMLLDCGFEIVTSRCFLFWLSPQLKLFDRFLAHTAIPISMNPLTQGMIGLCTSEELMYKITKNLYDHVAVVAQKPL